MMARIYFAFSYDTLTFSCYKYISDVNKLDGISVLRSYSF